MSKHLDIFLKPSATAIGWHGPQGYEFKDLPADSKAFAKALSAPKAELEVAGRDIDLYVGEDLLFFSTITLPLQTPDITKAIALQLDMLSPFGEDSLSAYTAQRSKEGYQITLYLCRKSLVTPFLKILFKAGAHLTGLYPESQRYLTRDNQKLSWSLWSPGQFGKITHFEQGKVVSRDLCAAKVSGAEIKERTKSAILFSLGNNVDDATSALPLLGQPARAREYNMLPPTFRHPDYMKKALVALAAINLVLILLLGGGKGLALYRQANVLDQQIEATKTDSEEALQIEAQIKNIKKQMDAHRAMGANSNLIAFMAKLSKELPNTAYLDQLRFAHDRSTITLQGYTDELPSLTASIPQLGTATLKSTMRRKKQTYFHLEVSLP